jgi:hypothetical protein
METSVSSVSAQQAADALLDVRRAQHRLSILRGYEYGAPHFLVWGCVWAIGYASSALWPSDAGVIWLVLDALGLLGGLLIVRATPTDGTRSARSWRFLAAGAAITAFIVATYYVMAPNSGPQFGAFPALVLALFYVLVGIWRGPRWAVVGLAVGGLTVVGYGLFREYFMLWMAVLGGGSLLLTGFWMRAA